MAYSPRSGGMRKTSKNKKTFLERFGTKSQRAAGDKRVAAMESKPKPKPKAAAAKPKASSAGPMTKPGGGRKRPSQKTSPGEVFGTASMRAKPKAAAAKPKTAAAKPKAAAAKPKASASKFGAGTSKTIMHKGREMANVTAEQLKASGLSLRAYMNQWNKTGKRPK